MEDVDREMNAGVSVELAAVRAEIAALARTQKWTLALLVGTVADLYRPVASS